MGRDNADGQRIAGTGGTLATTPTGDRITGKAGPMTRMAYRCLYAPACFGNPYEVMGPAETQDLLHEARKGRPMSQPRGPLLGLCPIGKFVFSREDALKHKQALQTRLGEVETQH